MNQQPPIPPAPPTEGNNGQYYPPYLKPKPVYNASEQVAALLCLLLGYAFVRLVLFRHPGIGVTLFAAAFLPMSIGFYKKNGVSFSGKSVILLLLSVLFVLPFSLFSDSVILVPLLFFWILCTALWATETAGIRLGHLFSRSMLALFGVPFGSFHRGFPALEQLCKKMPAQKTLTRVLIGLLIALPVTGLVSLLLISADKIFADMMQQLDRFLSVLFRKNIFEFIRDLLFTVPLFLYLFGLIDGGLRFEMPAAPAVAYPAAPRRRMSPLILCIAVTPLLLLYIAFFCAQTPYYFAAFSAYLPEGFTVASFARRGFFELCVVSFINFAVLLALQTLAAKREDGKTAKSIRIYSMLLSLFTLLLITTALRKMLLYIQNFGLTKLRVLTCWLMLLLAACFILITLYQFLSRLPVKKWITAVSVVFIALPAFGNIDGMIAHYNVTAYQSGDLESIDITHLYSLSADAIPYTVPLLEDDDPSVVFRTQLFLEQQKEKLDQRSFPEYSLSLYRARKALEILDK